MKDDELMAELLEAHARHDAVDPLRDPLWEKLAAGTLTPDERKVLDARALTDESVRDAIALLAPLGDGFEARVVAKIEAAKTAPAPRANAGSAPETSSNVLIFRRRAIGLIGALAVAASVAFLALRTPSPSEGSLPKYAMLVSGGQKEVRSNEPAATGSVVQVGPDSELSLVFRPAESVAGGGIGLRALLVREGIAAAWEPPFKVSASGVVQIVGPAASLGLGGPGDVLAIVAVGRGLPADPHALLNADDHAPASATYQIFRANLRVSSR